MAGFYSVKWLTLQPQTLFSYYSNNNFVDKAIFFHVGLGKVASTYLQYAFFPKLKGIYYIQRTRYKKSKEIIRQTNHPKYLVSREFDQQLEAEVRDFSAAFPQARPILLLRRHDGWIASQYRRYVKNGGHKTFAEFIDLERDQGVWPKSDLYFFRKIQILESCFTHKPLVLFHEDLKKDSGAFFHTLAESMGATYDPASVSLDPVHRSYSETQLRLMLRVSKYLFKENPQWHKNPVVHWIQRRSRLLLSYLILYPGRLIPEKWVPQTDLTPKADLDKIRAYFEEDWNQCREYAKRGVLSAS